MVEAKENERANGLNSEPLSYVKWLQTNVPDGFDLNSVFVGNEELLSGLDPEHEAYLKGISVSRKRASDGDSTLLNEKMPRSHKLGKFLSEQLKIIHRQIPLNFAYADPSSAIITHGELNVFPEVDISGV
jgi:hypothetical protein